ncbi:hypothetical protein QBC40DRAFT_317097 [Triangularia verruculosa]|uniref:F-box domain-containing protein n=1 Tax=Triangularia verruculosa TaxID=2587418 RepID=A0AAN7AYP9_9PEZI|nr:hypothetical protein QBC40DRAFT_317097 [Triangularia verruculosa]
MFEHLPEELLRQVSKGLSIQDLKSLSLVSKTFHAIWSHRFWNKLCVNTAGPTDRPSSVNISRIEQCALALQNATRSTQNVVDLVFRRDTRWKLWDYENEEDWPNVACLHRQPPPGDSHLWKASQRAAPVAGFSGDVWSLRNRRCIVASIERMEEQPDPDPMDDIALATQSVIERVPAGQLQSFTWDLAACIPQAVLDILFQTQPQLESISVTSDACCMAAGEILPLPFRQLKRIIWNSLPRSHIVPVQKLLETNRGHLHDLQIENLADGCSFEELLYGGEGCDDISHGGCANECHRELVANPAVLFPSLTTLSLRGIVLTESIDRAFKISSLRALTLRQCTRLSEFLKRTMATNSCLQLKTFEFKSNHGSGDDGGEEETNTVNNLLLSFEGLENLFIGFTKDIYRLPPGDSDDLHPLWGTVGHHGSTLKKLVIHRRGVWRGQSCTMGLIQRNFDDVLDIGGGLDIREPIINMWRLDPFSNPLSTLPNLECLGLPCAVTDWSDPGTSLANTRPGVRSEPLFPFTSTSRRLKLLHLRQTGSGLKTTGSRAFKPTGRPARPGERRANPDNNTRDTEDRDLTVAFTPAEVKSMLNPEFTRFLNWIFGREGIRSLEAVAFGDFANGHLSGKYLHNMFACRSSDKLWKYQVFDCRDKAHQHEWRDMADNHADFLESCPVGPRVEHWGHGSRYHF